MCKNCIEGFGTDYQNWEGEVVHVMDWTDELHNELLGDRDPFFIDCRLVGSYIPNEVTHETIE